MRRRHDAVQRRRDLCDAAIRLLAHDGAKGLSHLKVDRAAGVPNGTTSFYYRSRSALLCGIANRVAEHDAQALAFSVGPNAEASSASPLATAVIRAGTEPHLTRTRARVELTLQANSDPALAEIMRRQSDELTTAYRAGMGQLLPDGAEVDTETIDDLTTITMTFINGLLLRFAQRERVISTARQLDAVLSSIIAGVLVSDHRGRLTDGKFPQDSVVG